MRTKKNLWRSVIGAAALAIIPLSFSIEESLKMTEPYRKDKPLRQLQQEFIDLRFGMFIHFNMATFQDREWGDPKGPTSAFDPTDLDTDQWAAAAKSAGMRYGCLTTKHHDGFALWPTKTKGDSILQTPKKIDVVRRYVDSFRKQGLRVGLYYSILDLRGDIRHHNVTPAKIKLIKDQLTELLTNYGPIDILIFDGWDAPWSRIPYEEIRFDEIYALVKKLQPNCLISELNASQYPASALYYTDIKSFEQNAGQVLPNDSKLPALSCVTLTDGWFWKQSDKDAELKSVNQVVNEWLIPQNERFCTTILNAAPNREGKLSPNIVKRLEEIGKAWKYAGPVGQVEAATVITTLNLATGLPIRASSSPDTIGPDLANDGRFNSTWYPEHAKEPVWLEVEFPRPTAFNTLLLAEPVGRWNDYAKSRIKNYQFQYWSDGRWVDLASGISPSRVQIHEIARVTAQRVRLTFEGVGQKEMPHISELGIYDEPR